MSPRIPWLHMDSEGMASLFLELGTSGVCGHVSRPGHFVPREVSHGTHSQETVRAPQSVRTLVKTPEAIQHILKYDNF